MTTTTTVTEAKYKDLSHDGLLSESVRLQELIITRQLEDDEQGLESARELLRILSTEGRRREAETANAKRIELGPLYTRENLSALADKGKWIEVYSIARWFNSDLADVCSWLCSNRSFEGFPVWWENVERAKALIGEIDGPK